MISDETVDAVARLRKYVREQIPGTMLDYVSVQIATGIAMRSEICRRLLRHAAKKENLEFEVLRNVGIRLASAQNAADMSEGGVIKTARCASRHAKRSKRLIEKHAREMNDEDKKRIIAHGAGFGAIVLATSGAFARKLVPATPEPPPPRLPR